MDVKKIGGFLKKLRQEKKVTQEQLAEIIGVSGRTISRWETGSNMPELSILIQLAEYYDVDISEILNGERKGEVMNSELKETLLKVADYSEMEKKKALKAGNNAFMCMFGICVIAVVVQILLTVDLRIVIGETIAMVLGGIVYISIMVKNGIWEINSKAKNTLLRDMIISVLCAGAFSIVYGFVILKKGADEAQALQLGVLFFVGIMVIGFVVLRVLASVNHKKRMSK